MYGGYYMFNTKAIEETFNTWQAQGAGEFSGVISVSNKDGVIFEKVSGFRNVAEELPNEADTAFAIALGTKLFTVAAVCQLIDQGKLALDAKVWDILPQDLKQIDKDITVFHLLTHSSGVMDWQNDELVEGVIKEAEVEDITRFGRSAHEWTSNEFYLQFFNDAPGNFKPGEGWGYSNSGYILLGLVIEAISGQSYYDYIEEHIIKPLNLTHTGFYRSDSLPKNTAIGYMNYLLNPTANYFHMPVIGAADGGLYSSAADMAKFWQGVFDCKLFSKEMLDKFASDKHKRWRQCC